MLTQTKKRKVHSLTGRITADFMMISWKAVKRNRGAAGIDKISTNMYEAHVHIYLERLMKLLKTRDYVPKPLKRVHIPKGDGKLRPLGIPTVDCRIAQEVVRRLVNPIFEKRFHESSYGFRPGRNCHQAVLKAKEYLADGYEYIVDADIKGFFDNIPHELIMTEVANEIADGNILQLIERFLKSGVMEEGQLRPTTKGTPQGGVISPLLANIVLNKLDWTLEKHSFKFVRYADDFIILCKSEHQAHEALNLAKQVLGGMGLELSAEKTKVCHKSEGFNFLGFHFGRGGITMREKSEMKFREKVRTITTRCHNLDQKLIMELNQVIRGTVNYFATPFTKVKKVFQDLDSWIRKRIRCMKYKRINKRDNWRMKNKYIRRLGLLSCYDLCRMENGC